MEALARGSSTMASCPSSLQPRAALPAPRRAARVRAGAARARTPYPPPDRQIATDAPDVLYDAVIVGGGMGGLTTAAKLVEKGAKVLVLEKYLIPGGSAAHFKREGYTFDVGSSMMFGFGDKGTTNLITKALEAVGKRMETVPDPTQVNYHLPRSAAHPEVGPVTVYMGQMGRQRGCIYEGGCRQPASSGSARVQAAGSPPQCVRDRNEIM